MITEGILTVFLGILALEDVRKMEVSFLTLSVAAGSGIFFLVFQTFDGWVSLFCRLLPGVLLLLTGLLTGWKIGAGDGITFLVCGLFLKTEKVLGLLAVSFLIASVAAAVFLAVRRKTKKESFAFLPCVFAAEMLGLIISAVA